MCLPSLLDQACPTMLLVSSGVYRMSDGVVLALLLLLAISPYVPSLLINVIQEVTYMKNLHLVKKKPKLNPTLTLFAY